jgi:hypothetical protein
MEKRDGVYTHSPEQRGIEIRPLSDGPHGFLLNLPSSGFVVRGICTRQLVPTSCYNFLAEYKRFDGLAMKFGHRSLVSRDVMVKTAVSQVITRWNW